MIGFAPSPARLDALRRAADAAAVLLVVSLPWSTTATGILTAAWLILAVPTLSARDLLDECRRPRSAIGLLILATLAVSVLWSAGTWRDVSIALGSLVKLLALPVLVVHLRGRPAAWTAIHGFLASVAVVLALSWIAIAWPSGPWWWMPQPGVATRDYGIQNVLFVIAAFAATHLGLDAWKAGRRERAAAYAVFVALLLASIVYVQVSRTTLFVLPVLALILAWQRTGSVKLVAAALAAVVVVGSAAWVTSDNLRARTFSVIAEIEAYREDGTITSSGLRLDYYLRSTSLLARSPWIGYGAGGTREVMAADARRTGASDWFVTSNPHNQMLWLGMQLGVAGLLLIPLLWFLHAGAFPRIGTGSMIGLGVVVQNVIYGQLNSHLSDYTTGWIYVLMVGVCMALADAERERSAAG
jgi:hypothetical protein